MTIKEELSQASQKLNDGNKILEEYQTFLDRATKITSVITDDTSKTNLASDKVGDNAVSMADLSKRYLQLFIEAETFKVELLTKLVQLDAPFGRVLWYRYVEGYKLYEIAELEHYSYKQMKRIYRQALNEYEKKHCNIIETKNVP